MPNGVSIIMAINLDDNETSVWWDANRTGAYSVLGGRENTPVVHSHSGATPFSEIDLVDALQFQSNGGPFSIDRLVLGTNFTEIASIGAIP